MKLVIFGAIALVVGLAGGTTARVFTAPALPVGADSLIALADSAYKAKHAKGAKGAGSHAAAASHDAANAAEAAASAHAEPAGNADPHAAAGAGEAPVAGQAAAVTAHAAPASSGPAPIPPPLPERYKQVGSILLNMKPVEAARVIAYLNDTQVHGLLDAMGPRQAATILSQLPAERAATLSKRLLISPQPEAR